MAQKLTKVAETTTLANTDTLIVVDESAQNPDGSTGALKRIPKSSTGFAFPNDITSAINTEVSNRNTAISNAIDTEVTNRNNAIDEALSEYAKVDGYYEEMAVGSAEQLLSTQFVEDSVPYKFRTSGGSKDIGNREYDEIVGGSIVWNQLYTIRPSSVEGGITFTNNGDGTLTLNGTTTRAAINIVDSSIKGTRNHVVLYADTKEKVNLYSGYGSPYSAKGVIFKNTFENTIGVYMYAPTGTTFDNVVICPQAFDLTKMFGSTVADYIYSLEQAQSGKGVAFFRSLFPNDYYSYNAGELLSVEGLQSHDTVGFNQWDEETESGTLDSSTGTEASNNGLRAKNYTRCVPNTSYHFTNTGTDVFCILCFYDASKNFISSLTNIHQGSNFTTPNNAQYFRFAIAPAYGTTYKNDICINLSWSGWRNGEYEPYKKHSYALDSSLTLRGILKLNAQNELYFDGDIYSHDGKVDRRMFVRRFIKEDAWTKDSEHEHTFRLLLTAIPTAEQPEGGLLKTATTHIYGGYRSLSSAEVGSVDGVYVNWTSALYVTVMSCSTLNEFKTWLDTNMLVLGYPITPTEETATPFEEVQIVDDFGTEEYISGNLVPVGHNTKYPANLRDKLQHLPNMADSDGAYLIRQTNKQMSLELFRIPKAPTTDGTYTLKATVSSGTPTYIWEAVE